LGVCLFCRTGLAGEADQLSASNIRERNANIFNNLANLKAPNNPNAESIAAMNDGYRHGPQVDYFNPGEIIIHWTSPGDDGRWGRAAGYDLRYRPQHLGPIDTEEAWMSSWQVDREPRPSVAGRVDSMAIRGLNYGAGYYFSLRSYDDAFNYSALSNSPLLISGDTAHSEIIPGDANGSGAVNAPDILYLIGYLQGTNPPPSPYLSGDANGDCEVNGMDIIYLMNFFKGTGDYPALGDCTFLLFDSILANSSERQIS
jgi:hypothetical protein